MCEPEWRRKPFGPVWTEFMLPTVGVWVLLVSTVGLLAAFGVIAGETPTTLAFGAMAASAGIGLVLRRRFLAKQKRTAEQPGEATKRRGERSR